MNAYYNVYADDSSLYSSRNSCTSFAENYLSVLFSIRTFFMFSSTVDLEKIVLWLPVTHMKCFPPVKLTWPGREQLEIILPIWPYRQNTIET